MDHHVHVTIVSKMAVDIYFQNPISYVKAKIPYVCMRMRKRTPMRMRNKTRESFHIRVCVCDADRCIAGLRELTA